MTSYVTGGGGAKVGAGEHQPVQHHRRLRRRLVATPAPRAAACGAAPVPTSDAKVYHFLKVNVSGTTVTVTPTDSTGATFDPVTYNFAANTTAPAAPTGLLASAVGSTVRLSWTASASSDSSAQDVYRDGRWLATVGPSATFYVDAAPHPAGAGEVGRDPVRPVDHVDGEDVADRPEHEQRCHNGEVDEVDDDAPVDHVRRALRCGRGRHPCEDLHEVVGDGLREHFGEPGEPVDQGGHLADLGNGDIDDGCDLLDLTVEVVVVLVSTVVLHRGEPAELRAAR